MEASAGLRLLGGLMLAGLLACGVSACASQDAPAMRVGDVSISQAELATATGQVAKVVKVSRTSQWQEFQGSLSTTIERRHEALMAGDEAAVGQIDQELLQLAEDSLQYPAGGPATHIIASGLVDYGVLQFMAKQAGREIKPIDQDTLVQAFFGNTSDQGELPQMGLMARQALTGIYYFTLIGQNQTPPEFDWLEGAWTEENMVTALASIWIDSRVGKLSVESGLAVRPNLEALPWSAEMAAPELETDSQ